MDTFDSSDETEYNSEDDLYSERNVMSKAFEIWSDELMNGNDSLTPPYKSMNNWYKRLGHELDPKDIDDDTEYNNDDGYDNDDNYYDDDNEYENENDDNDAYSDDDTNNYYNTK